MKKWTRSGFAPRKSAQFEVGTVDECTERRCERRRGGTTSSLKDGHDRHVAGVARTDPEEYALPRRKTLIQEDPSPAS